MYSGPGSRARSFFVKGGAPLTTALIVSNLATLLLGYAAPGIFAPAFRMLEFSGSSSLQPPWTFFTYPVLSEGSLFTTLLSCLVMWWFGASLERAWGTRWFAGFFFGISAAFAFSISLGTAALGMGGRPWAGLWLPTFGVFIAWALLNPNVMVNIWGVLPVKAAHLAIADVIVLWILIGNPVLGLFAQGGNLAAWAFVHWRPWNRFVGYREPRRRPRRTG